MYTLLHSFYIFAPNKRIAKWKAFNKWGIMLNIAKIRLQHWLSLSLSLSLSLCGCLNLVDDGSTFSHLSISMMEIWWDWIGVWLAWILGVWCLLNGWWQFCGGVRPWLELLGFPRFLCTEEKGSFFRGQVLDVLGIMSNLIVVYWILPPKKKNNHTKFITTKIVQKTEKEKNPTSQKNQTFPV